MVDWNALSQRLATVTGGDPDLDAMICEAFGQPLQRISESAELCRAFAALVAPGWHLHLGYGASGLLPYAGLAQADRHLEAEAPTVPLAILRVLVAALRP